MEAALCGRDGTKHAKLAPRVAGLARAARSSAASRPARSPTRATTGSRIRPHATAVHRPALGSPGPHAPARTNRRHPGAATLPAAAHSDSPVAARWLRTRLPHRAATRPTGERNPELPPPVGGIVARRRIVDPPGTGAPRFASPGPNREPMRPGQAVPGSVSLAGYRGAIARSARFAELRRASGSAAAAPVIHEQGARSMSRDARSPFAPVGQPRNQKPDSDSEAYVLKVGGRRLRGAVANSPAHDSLQRSESRSRGPFAVEPAAQSGVAGADYRDRLRAPASGTDTGPPASDGLDVLGPEAPLCPRDYEFDYEWQTAGPPGSHTAGRGLATSGPTRANASRASGWLADKHRCAKRGTVSAHVWGPVRGGSLAGAADCPLGQRWNAAHRYCEPATCIAGSVWSDEYQSCYPNPCIAAWEWPPYVEWRHLPGDCTSFASNKDDWDDDITEALRWCAQRLLPALWMLEVMWDASDEYRQYLWDYGYGTTGLHEERDPSMYKWFGPYRRAQTRHHHPGPLVGICAHHALASNHDSVLELGRMRWRFRRLHIRSFERTGRGHDQPLP